MRPKLIALIAVSAVALVGCSAIESTDSPEPRGTVEAKPLTMSSLEAAPSDSGEMGENSEREFLEYISPENSGWSGELPPAEDLLSAGYLACEKAESGEPEDSIEVIPGSLPTVTKKMEKELRPEELAEFVREGKKAPLAENNTKLVMSALSGLCKEQLLD